MQCPINKNQVSNPCNNSKCLYNSVTKENGCFFNQQVGIYELAIHKDIGRIKLKRHIDHKQRIFVRFVTLFRYLEYVSPKPASKKTKILWKRLRSFKPYSEGLFRDFTPEKLQAMQSKKTFRRFCKVNGIDKKTLLQPYQSVKEFITKQENIGENNE